MSVHANNWKDSSPQAEKTSTPDECFLFTQSSQLWITLSVTAENEWASLHEKGPLFNCMQERLGERERYESERDVKERWERCKVKGYLLCMTESSWQCASVGGPVEIQSQQEEQARDQIPSAQEIIRTWAHYYIWLTPCQESTLHYEWMAYKCNRVQNGSWPIWYRLWIGTGLFFWLTNGSFWENILKTKG